MRSSQPIPGEAWPHDMMISVDDRPNGLLELLWIREAHDLHPRGDDLPPLLFDTPLSVRDASIPDDVRRTWEAGWGELWHAIVRHLGRETNPDIWVELENTTDGSAQRRELLRQLAGPSWHEQFGGEALAYPTYVRWDEESFAAHVASRPETLQEAPERRDLTELIAAWHRGLTSVVTIPSRGDFARTISPTTLLTTDAIRGESASYTRALASFA